MTMFARVEELGQRMGRIENERARNITALVEDGVEIKRRLDALEGDVKHAVEEEEEGLLRRIEVLEQRKPPMVAHDAYTELHNRMSELEARLPFATQVGPGVAPQNLAIPDYLLAARPRHLGNRAVTPERSVELHCPPCNVTWTGCAAERSCPECGREYDWHPAQAAPTPDYRITEPTGTAGGTRPPPPAPLDGMVPGDDEGPCGCDQACRLESELEAARAQIATLQELRAELGAASVELKQMADERDRYADANLRIKADDHALRAELDMVTWHKESLRAELDGRELRYVHAQEERNALRAELIAANKACDITSGSRDAALAEVERLRALHGREASERMAAESSLANATELARDIVMNYPDHTLAIAARALLDAQPSTDGNGKSCIYCGSRVARIHSGSLCKDVAGCVLRGQPAGHYPSERAKALIAALPDDAELERRANLDEIALDALSQVAEDALRDATLEGCWADVARAELARRDVETAAYGITDYARGFRDGHDTATKHPPQPAAPARTEAVDCEFRDADLDRRVLEAMALVSPTYLIGKSANEDPHSLGPACKSELERREVKTSETES